MQYHQEKVAAALLSQTHMLQQAIDKIDGGLTDMRQKYAEDRMLRMKER